MTPQILPGENIEAFYFGGEDKPLFGIYHVPPKASTRSHGVLLVPSIEQEAIRGHRAYRQLAIRLSRLGFPVMKFDYWGTGDSKGDGAIKGLAQWQSDIAAAIAELKQRSKVDKVCLAGLRLGAALAVFTAEKTPIEGLALWEPVINGESYVEALAGWHQDKLRYFLSDMPDFDVNTQPTELLGLTINKAFVDDLRKIDLLKIQQVSAKKIVIVEHQEQPEVAAFRTHLQQWSSDIQHRTADDPRVWTDDPDKALVPNQILQNLVNWFSENFK
ncbi:MAG: alpha/beta hydrolase [Chloroflexi bacterium]|nr:alpha/beta hydrolase [Chloroflexota bacterium]MCC6892489.1 alpha/beta hydrolase [Anaerolineae bacterium]